MSSRHLFTSLLLGCTMELPPVQDGSTSTSTASGTPTTALDGTSLGAESSSTSGTTDAPESMPARYVFVSSSVHTGDLGGFTGADAICQELAAKNPKLEGRVFRAWLAAIHRWPRDTILDMDFDGLYLRTDDQVVDQALPFVLPEGPIVEPPDWPLYFYELQHPILLDEVGEPVAEPCDVWTNARSNGSPVGVTPDDCMEWTSTAGRSIAGRCSFTTPSWSRFDPGEAWTTCDRALHLYCFEVE